jgi:hypothetical protein
MSWGKTKRRTADTYWSRYIRQDHGWKCEKCGKFCGENGEFGQLDCCHYHGRRKESVRFDYMNTRAICAVCHRKFHEDKSLHTEFMIETLGQKNFDLLEIRANTPCRGKDDKAVILYCKSVEGMR